ncbi:uncharacterized protein LOC113349186 [Papaver somniferum]|uniref:uncharacterized protein LOC113349186 n=1 Tax=Papaver somniferum TaxID=3469 RepID=UPI000E703584|nr:uncharacterized protein LOC113349186 [Papaver somniferum]
MQEIEEANCPSFSSYSSSTTSVEDTAAKVIEEGFGFYPDGDNTNGEEENGDKDDFEFASVNFTDTTNPIFPVFNQDIATFEDDGTHSHNSSCPRLRLQRLFVEEFSSSTSSSSSSSTETDVDCIWEPKTFTTSPDRTYCPDKKSKSMGNSGNKLKSFKIRDLIHRSNSDQNKMYVYLANQASPLPSTNKGTKEDAKKMNRKLSAKKVSGNISTTAENEMVSASRSPRREGDKRRSFLQRDLIGFFGFYRKVYPFA